MSSCCLSKSVKIISTCSDCKNIRLAVVNIKSKNIECLRWLINGLIDYGMESPKIIIYCRTVNTVGWLFEKLLNELKEHAYQNKDKKSDNFLIGMYHAQTSEKNKTKVLQSLTTSEGIVRVLCLGSLAWHLFARKPTCFVFCLGSLAWHLFARKPTCFVFCLGSLA